MPIPHGASFMYLEIAALLTSRTFAEASSGLNADLMRRIWLFPWPMSVNISIPMKSPNTMETGTMILTDLDNMRNTINPAIIQKMAVRVPD